MLDALQFFDAASAAFARAGAGVGVRQHDFDVAGRRVRVRFAGPGLEHRLLPALAHVRAEDAERTPVALTVSCFDSATTGVRMPPPPWSHADHGPKGEIVGFNDDRIRTVFEPGVDVLNMYDGKRRAAVYWVAAADVVPWWESSFPFRTILHWWTASTSLQPLHAGCVGGHGRGVLVAGESGAGKSTTTLAALEAGLDYAGDDYVLVDTETCTAYSLYSTAKLAADNLERFPTLAPLVANADRLDREKAMVFLHDHRPERLATALRLRAIVVPRVTGRSGSHLEPISPATALRALAPTTSFHLPGYGREVFAKLTRLVRARPCHRLDAGTDLEELAAVLATLTTP
jgi:hypothetical protein